MPFVVGLAFVVPACSDAGNEPVKNNQNLGLNYDNNWRFVNNLDGDYTIEFYDTNSAPYKWKKLCIHNWGSSVPVFNSSTTVIGVHNSDPFKDYEEVAPHSRFTFVSWDYADEDEGRNATYYISSPYDPHGKVYVKDKNYSKDSSMIVFEGHASKDAQNDKAMIFMVEKDDKGYCRFIVMDNSNKQYYLSMKSKTDISALCVKSSPDDLCVFRLTPVVKNTQPLSSGISKNTYGSALVEYVDRTLEGVSNSYSCSSILGHQYSLGYGFTTNDDDNSTFVPGPEYDLTNRRAYVAPGYNLTFYFSSTYKAFLKYNNHSWTESSLGNGYDSYNENRDWYVYEDNYEDRKVTDYSGNDYSVLDGLAILYVGKSEYALNPYYCFNLNPSSSDLLYNRITVDSELLLNGGNFFRLEYQYTIRCQHNHYIKKNKYDTSYQVVRITEVSSTIHAAYSYLEEGSFSPINVYTYGFDYSSSDEGSDVNCYFWNYFDPDKGILKADSATIDLVYINKNYLPNGQDNPYSSNYSIFVKQSNATKWTEVTDTWRSSDGVYGKIDIKLRNIYGDELIQSVYCLDYNNLTKNFVGEPFGIRDTDTAFISGNRILGGSSSTLEKMGIHLPYSTYLSEGKSVPLYSKKVDVHFNGYNNLWCSFAVYRNKEYCKEYSSDTQGPVNLTLTKEGFYKIKITPYFNYECGNQIEFTFEFYIINDEPEPFLNRELIYNASNNVYDLNPRYYLVKQEVGAITFVYEEDGVEKRATKQKQLFYAFANYEEALSLALRIEKGYVQHEEDSEEYTYTKGVHTVTLNEFELFQAMYENAKKNVQVSYFALANPSSIQGIYYSDEEIQEFINKTEKEVDSPGDAQDIYLIVAENSLTLQELLVKQSIINDYKFLNVLDGNDSSAIVMYNAVYKDYHTDDQNIYIPYGVRMADELKRQGVRSGRYIVHEFNKYGKNIKYEVTYIEEGGDPSATLSFKGVTENDDGVYQGKSFSFESFKGIYDEAPFIIVRYQEKSLSTGKMVTKEDVYTLSNYKDANYTKANTYEVTLYDRVGNEKTYTVEIKK